jgi:hypothetical protein
MVETKVHPFNPTYNDYKNKSIFLLGGLGGFAHLHQFYR